MRLHFESFRFLKPVGDQADLHTFHMCDRYYTDPIRYGRGEWYVYVYHVASSDNFANVSQISLSKKISASAV